MYMLETRGVRDGGRPPLPFFEIRDLRSCFVDEMFIEVHLSQETFPAQKNS